MEKLYDNYEDTLPSYKYSMILYRGGYVLRTFFIALLRLTGNHRISESAQKAKPLS